MTPTDEHQRRAIIREVVDDLTMSVEVGDLFTALSKAHADEAWKSSIHPEGTGRVGAGGSREYKYATLPDALDQVTPVLAQHGLTFAQPIAGDKLVNLLTHDSGQFMMAITDLSGFVAPIGGNTDIDAKARGAAVTYARRYTGFSFLGISGGGDDNEDQVPDTPTQPRRQTFKPKAEQSRPAQRPAAQPAPKKESPAPRQPRKDQRFFGSAAKGEYRGWLAEVKEVSREDKEGGWVFSVVRTVSGEELGTFNTEDAQTCQQAIDAKVPVDIRWERRTVKGEDKINIVTDGVTYVGEVESAEYSLESMDFEVLEVRKASGRDAWIVTTDSGVFGCLDPDAAGTLEQNVENVCHVTFVAVPAGRLIKSARGEHDAAPEPTEPEGDSPETAAQAEGFLQ